jgi:hypothetical protein
MTDVLELLKRADPVDARELRSHEPPADVLEAILATPQREAGRRERQARTGRGPRRRVRLFAPAVGLGLAAVVAVAVLVGGGARPDEAAAAALERIADAARTQPPTLAPGDGRFLYFQSESRSFLAMADERPFHRGIRTPDDFGFLLNFRATQEAWVGDSNGLVRNTMTAPTFATARDRRTWEQAGRPRLPQASDDESPTNSGIERLRIPTEPAELVDYMRARADEQDEGNAWIFGTLFTDYLREWGLTPKQRAALYDAAARLPGVELLGKRKDPDGRSGIGFAISDDDAHVRHTLIVNPDTGELLAQIDSTLPGGPIPPRATTETVFHSPTLVDTAGDRP